MGHLDAFECLQQMRWCGQRRVGPHQKRKYGAEQRHTFLFLSRRDRDPHCPPDLLHNVKRVKHIVGVGDPPELQGIAQAAGGEQIQPVTIFNSHLDQ